MKCILLCAGNFIKELNESVVPSALIKVNSKPILNYTLEQLVEIEELTDIYVVTNGVYYDSFLNWKNNYKFPKVRIINDNTTSANAKLGAIGDIMYTINSENIDEDILVLAGDSYFDFSIKELVGYYNKINGPVIAGLKCSDEETLSRYGVLKSDNGIVVGMQEKPKNPEGDIISLAAYLYPRDVLRDFEDYLAEGNLRTFPGYFVQYLYRNRNVYIFETHGKLFNVKDEESRCKLSQHIDASV